MIIQSVLQVFRLTCINLIRLRKGLQSVNVVIIFHDDRPASVSKQQETTAGSLRLSRDFPRILSCPCWPASRSSLSFTSEGWWSRWVTLPHQPACRAGALLVCHDPKEKLASRPGAAPGELSFGDSAARAGARLVEIKRAGSVHAPGPCHFNKEQTPPGDLFDPSPRFHGGCFGV